MTSAVQSTMLFARSDTSLVASDEVSPLQMAVLLALYIGLWLLMTPYAGLTHDAQAYAFQAIARHDPAGIGQDIFLKYQSQDSYTLFPVVYSWLINALGLETAAVTLTLPLHLLWFAFAFLVARALFGNRLGLLCLGLLIVIPAPYGGQRVFHLAEPFLTARLPAEVLVLVAIWSLLTERRAVMIVSLLAALLVHPLMAFPAALLCGLFWADQWRETKFTLPIAGIGIVVVSIVGSLALGGADAIMASDWVANAHSRSAFLFLDRWLPSDWNHTLLSLLTLLLTALALPSGPATRIAWSALSLGIAGLALAWIAGEIWHLKLLMQGQPWRWLWLVRFFAIVTLPATLLVMWRSDSAGKGAALFLVAAWMAVAPVGTRNATVTLMAAILATASFAIWMARARVPNSTSRLFYLGGYAVLGIVVAAVAVIASLGLAVKGQSGAQSASQIAVLVLNLIAPAIAVTVAGWFLTMRTGRTLGPAVVLVIGVALIGLGTPGAAERWSQRRYEGAAWESFADWRAMIPAGSEVFWWDGLRETWFLLQRRSYLTLSQGGGVVFSGDVGRELRRRADVARDFMDPGYWFNEADRNVSTPYPLTTQILGSMCRDTMLGFVVGAENIGANAPRKEWPQAGHYIYLYDCSQFRHETT